MAVEEVDGIERVGRGVMGLLWLWKCVEKSKAPHVKPTCGAPPKRPGHPPSKVRQRLNG